MLCHRANVQPHLEVNSNYDFYKIPGNTVEQKIAFSKTVLKEKPVYPDSGSTYVYSNAGIMMAAAMLEKVSGKSWEKLIDDLDKDIGVDFKTGFPNQANIYEPWGHILNNDTIFALPPDFDYKIATVMRPAGDLNIDLYGYVKFIRLIMNGYNGKDNFIKSETYKYLLTEGLDYSFGWANKEIKGKHYNYHSGSGGTFGCFVKYNREDNIAAIVMENYCDGGALNALQTIADHLLNKYSNK